MTEFLQQKLESTQYEKLKALENPRLLSFIEQQVKHLNPGDVFVCEDTEEDLKKIRENAIKWGEEHKLKTQGHTYHFDGVQDQARDPPHTKLLTNQDIPKLNTLDREEGLEEIQDIMEGIMEDKTLLIMFFTLGPLDSKFSIPCIQLTDSAYVAHSETILYRQGYEQMRKTQPQDFFGFIHSAGRLNENNTSADVEKRRIYIDLEGNRVYSANTQYGGNTIGLKKLAMRLAIQKASKEGWLCEHMFVMGVGDAENRVTYFTGAYPSACGKTSTSMIAGENIVGDDIAYLKKIGGQIRAVNVEQGIFGIIRDVNSINDPIIYNALTRPGEVIFSNILVKEDTPHWMGKDGGIPKEGVNYQGEWFRGKKDGKGNQVTPSHKNARYTLRIDSLENKDANLHNPQGVKVGGIIYGGRDSDTTVPVEESFNWIHGITTKGASLESETTAATLGQEGVRKFNMMSNMDFLSIPLHRYLKDNLRFQEGAENPPKIFSVNYFLKEDGKYLNAIEDKHVWLKWMQLRVNQQVDAIETPTGLIPHHEDLRRLFRDVLNKEYAKQDYETQFTVRVPQLLEKIKRVTKIYEDIPDTPKQLFEELEKQKQRLTKLKGEKGDYVTPSMLTQVT